MRTFKKIFTISIILFLLGFYVQSILSQESNAPSVELKFSIDTRFGKGKGIFKKSKLNILDKSLRTGFLEIETASIDTGLSMRDNHLRNEDFFDVKKFPKAVFEILETRELSKENLLCKGKLTIKGISKEYEFQVKFTSDGKTEKYSGKLKINRKDFGIVYNSTINPIQDNAEVEFLVTMPVGSMNQE